jgi:hypothetical protein
MKLSKLIPAACLGCLGIASGQGLYNIMPYEDDPAEGLPLHWTVALNLGYDNNPSPVLSDCPGFDSDGAMYVSGSIQGNFVMQSPRTVIDAWARLGVTYYIDEIQQTSAIGTTVGSSDDTFYTTQFGLNVTHNVNERLRIRSRSNFSYEQEPDYDSGLATDRRQGQYFRYSTDNSVGYRWTERLGTVTGYRLNGVVWQDSAAQDSMTHTIYNQFRYRTSERTVLTADVRYGIQNNSGYGDSDSIYLLLGAEHEFSETTVGVLRVGAQRFSPDGGSDSWSPYVEGTIRTQVNEQFGLRAFVYYGAEGRDRSVWTHDCDIFMPMPTSTASLVNFDQRNILRIGSQGSYVVSESLTVFGGVNVVFDSYKDGTYLLNGVRSGTPFFAGTSAPDFDEMIYNLNIGASVKLTENVYMTGSYNYSNSSSDADIRDYDRQRIQLGIQTSL